MEGTVTARGVSKKGNPLITVDQQLYVAPKCNVSQLQIGDRISFDAHSFGKDGWELDTYKLLSGASKYPPSVPQPSNGIAAPTSPQQAQGGITDAERPFISNCVAHAIASGCIKEPEQIEKWVAAAKNALRNQSE